MDLSSIDESLLLDCSIVASLSRLNIASCWERGEAHVRVWDEAATEPGEPGEVPHAAKHDECDSDGQPSVDLAVKEGLRDRPPAAPDPRSGSGTRALQVPDPHLLAGPVGRRLGLRGKDRACCSVGLAGAGGSQPHRIEAGAHYHRVD